MDESRPRPHPEPHPAQQPPAAPSRRWFLAGGAAVLLGAGAGVGAEFVHNDHAPKEPPPAPPALVAAVAAERALIADLDATTGGAPEVRQVIVQVRADHAAHLAALTDLLARYRRPVGSPSPSAAPGAPRTLAQLNAAEHAAAAAAAGNAASNDGALAAMFASIAACETTHAELLR